MDTKHDIEIVICLGSSCFARGNKQSVRLIQSFLKEKGLEGKVLFKGRHCFGHCETGPALLIGEKLIEHCNPESVVDILSEELSYLISSNKPSGE